MRSVPCSWMRGGTSKGLFFHAADLPPWHADPTQRAELDAICLRAMGSPDPYGTQMDGLGGGTSSTSKVVLVTCVPAELPPDHDLAFRFGAVAVAEPLVDWSGNCGNLTTAVALFALQTSLLKADVNRLTPANDNRRATLPVHLWQQNLGKTIIAHVPMLNGQPLEEGGFTLDGVAFPGAETVLEFIDPAGEGSGDDDDSALPLLPTGRVVDTLHVPGVGSIPATLITAGNPTVFVPAAALGLTGTERQAEVNTQPALLQKLEAVRAAGAVAMGLATSAEQATRDRPATPKVAWVAPPAAYTTPSGAGVAATDIHLVARIVSMGKLHHAFTGTGAVALAAAAALPGSMVAQCLRHPRSGDGLAEVCFGHASGRLTVAAEVQALGDGWAVKRVRLSRSARRLMAGAIEVGPIG